MWLRLHQIDPSIILHILHDIHEYQKEVKIQTALYYETNIIFVKSTLN